MNNDRSAAGYAALLYTGNEFMADLTELVIWLVFQGLRQTTFHLTIKKFGMKSEMTVQ